MRSHFIFLAGFDLGLAVAAHLLAWPLGVGLLLFMSAAIGIWLHVTRT